MSKKLCSRSWVTSLSRLPLFFFERTDDDWIQDFDLSGLSVSEDDDHVYIEAALPGITLQEVEVAFDKGILWIKAEKNKEQTSTKKYYRKATSQFSYRIAVPSTVDESEKPEAKMKHGIMHMVFLKNKSSIS